MDKKLRKLDHIFNPKSVAIVGASATPNKIGNVLIRNFIDGKFQGKIYPVNPKYEDLFGFRCYPKVSQIKGMVDLVIIATPAETIPSIVEDCSNNCGGIVILSGGFEEVERRDLAAQVKKIADDKEIPIIGPNCLGVFNPYNNTDSIFLPRYKLERPKPGAIAFVTQSGAVGSTVMDLAAYYGIGLSKFISYGNGTVLDESDYLEYLMHDKKTEIIILYIEGVRDGRKLLKTMKKVNKIKPIIALKAGKGIRGQAAAKSHTGNIAGNYLAYNAAFKQAKVTEAAGITEVFDLVKIFNQPKPKGKRIGVITNGGGIGVLTTDHIEQEGLIMADYSDETKAELKKILPSYGNVINPLDLVADADIEGYDKAINIFLKDKNIDAIIIIVLLQTPPIDERIIHILAKASDDRRKPIAVISIGGAYTEEYRRIMESKGVPTYNSPGAAVKAIERLITYSEYCEKLKMKKS